MNKLQDALKKKAAAAPAEPKKPEPKKKKASTKVVAEPRPQREEAAEEEKNALYSSKRKKERVNITLDADLIEDFEDFAYKNRKKKKYFLSTTLNDLLREMLHPTS